MKSHVALLASLALLACDGSPTGPRAGAKYYLATVDGQPPPVGLDTAAARGEYGPMHYRVRPRTLEFLSADSAQYAWGTDAVEAMPDGSFRLHSGQCTSMMVAYERTGGRIVLTIDPNVFLSPGEPRARILHDTLEVAGDRLVQYLRRMPNLVHVYPRTWRLEYRPGEPVTDVCPSFPQPSGSRFTDPRWWRSE